ncbi:plant UBX domain-containing protein 1 isoform X2 [Silene latifolia]|uniref:plant UBX domain-containing protein 1 isoform X2 n=2 Tax=Silene latifolia TaxID=37657 RepID=UPI003D788712
MNFDSPLAWKRRRMEINPMDMESANAKLEAAKQNYGRDIRVFETMKVSQPAPTAVSTTEETDEFFEFTPEDYYRLMAGKKEDKYLKTKKIREAEAMARRSRITKAVIRVRFPDGITLEATFHPSEPLQSVFDLLNKVLARPELSYYLYTTPPKKQIKDTNQNFFDAGFIPGAIVHFSYDLPRDDPAYSSPFLREDVMSLNGLELVSESTKEPIEAASETVPAIPPPAAERKPADKKAIKPKWLKM